jgi:hypothetical protein
VQLPAFGRVVNLVDFIKGLNITPMRYITPSLLLAGT